MEQTHKTLVIDLRRLNNAFVTNIKSQATGVTKRVIAIPIEDNFIEEAGYTNRSGQEIRTAKMQVKMWPVSEDSKQQFGRKNDYNLRLDISKSQREALEHNNPSLAQQLNYSNAAYDKEISRKLLPYVGNGYESSSNALAPEQISTTETIQDSDNNDLPF